MQPKTNTKKQRIIEYKIKHPSLSLKEIARKTTISYTYVRQVWSKYKRKMITLKGSPISPLPLTVQNFGWTVDGQPRWYSDCPVVPSNNRNRQKVYRSAYYTMVIHSSGGALIHPYHENWVKELRGWLDTWMLPTEANMFIEFLNPLDQKHVCIPAPGVPKGYKFHVPGVGTLTTDGTPYKKGTLEFEFDPQIVKRLDSLEKVMEKQVELGEKQLQATEVYAQGMDEHMKLIGALQEVAFSMRDSMADLKDLFTKLFEKLE